MGVASGRRVQKGCSQVDGNQEGCGAWKVTIS